MSARQEEPQWVEDAVALQAVCSRAAGARRVAVDTEADSFHSYFHKLCLVQLSFEDQHVLVDPLAIGRDGMAALGELCADSSVVKVFHGADYDVRVLQRDLGARVTGLADTQLAAQLLGEPQTGLAAMLLKELGIVVGKEHQRADFSVRPLPRELRRYASADTAHLCALADRLGERLAVLGRTAWWHEDCRVLERVEWEESGEEAGAFERIRGGRRLKGVARDRLAALARWREERAAALDVPPFRVMRNEVLLQLAENPPGDLLDLGQRPGVGRGTARRHGKELLDAINAPSAAPPRVAGERRVVDRERERRVKALRDVRDAAAAGLCMSGSVLAPRSAMEATVDRHATTVEALRECLGREWRTSLLAPHFLPLVQSWSFPVGRADAAAV